TVLSDPSGESSEGGATFESEEEYCEEVHNPQVCPFQTWTASDRSRFGSPSHSSSGGGGGGGGSYLAEINACADDNLDQCAAAAKTEAYAYGETNIRAKPAEPFLDALTIGGMPF